MPDQGDFRRIRDLAAELERRGADPARFAPEMFGAPRRSGTRLPRCVVVGAAILVAVLAVMGGAP